MYKTRIIFSPAVHRTFQVEMAQIHDTSESVMMKSGDYV